MTCTGRIILLCRLTFRRMVEPAHIDPMNAFHCAIVYASPHKVILSRTSFGIHKEIVPQVLRISAAGSGKPRRANCPGRVAVVDSGLLYDLLFSLLQGIPRQWDNPKDPQAAVKDLRRGSRRWRRTGRARGGWLMMPFAGRRCLG